MLHCYLFISIINYLLIYFIIFYLLYDVLHFNTYFLSVEKTKPVYLYVHYLEKY